MKKGGLTISLRRETRASFRGFKGLRQLVPDRRGREPFLVKASIAAGRDLPRIVVHGDAALEVIGSLSCDRAANLCPSEQIRPDWDINLIRNRVSGDRVGEDKRGWNRRIRR